MPDTKVIQTELNGRIITLEITVVNNIPYVRTLYQYSPHCYETNTCCACKEDRSGKTCLNVE